MDDFVNDAEAGLDTISGEVREFLYGVDLVYISLLSSVFFITLIIFDIAYNFAFPGRFDVQRRRRQWRAGHFSLTDPLWDDHQGGGMQSSASSYPFTDAYWRDRCVYLTQTINLCI